MKILHTSDWHIGSALYGRKRYEEFKSFLNWLVALIESEDIDVLLVAGDVFDNSTPSNRAQEIYYRFLCRVWGIWGTPMKLCVSIFFLKCDMGRPCQDNQE